MYVTFISAVFYALRFKWYMDFVCPPLSQTANSKDEEFAENKITDKACIQCVPYSCFIAYFNSAKLLCVYFLTNRIH